ncbi:unnamed protein product [Symbiodinium necroappetens]|uniref:Uncharacterized protein n=1 Tax=Symbiodinium necroappetens TaxID=1628268 RepID=A0A812MYE4_9DINO|nr:unnamed protein product [Symbiodinium necroappetens]
MCLARDLTAGRAVFQAMPMPAQPAEEESVAASSHSQHFEHTNASSYKFEHTGVSTLKKAHSCLSQGTTAMTGVTPDNNSVASESHAPAPELNAIKADVENALPCGEAVSIWTRSTIGIVLNGFLLAFLSAICRGVIYGFFLGYMGLDSYVLASIAALMKLPDVFPLAYGILTDCFPIRGQKRKPWLLISWTISAGALLAMSLKPQPGPLHCFENGEYNWYVPPCNPGILKEKNWYVFPMFILTAGLQLGAVSGEALLLEYSQLEPLEHRGQIKAEMTVVCTAGALASSLFIGIFMNGKEYLGTFDWGLSFSGLMAVCLVLVILIIPVTVMCVYEPPKSGQRTSCRAHVKSSWELVQGKALSSILFFAFIVQFLFSMTTTAGPMVRSQWAQVKVLQQQMFGMAGLCIMMASTWIYRVYFLQASWRKAIFAAIFAVNVLDAIPQFLTTFDLVRNQYFYLGEDVVSSIPNAVLQLVSNLMIIELAEPGREGLSFGLIGTLQHSAMPFATVISNQVYGLFDPKLSNIENYILDTPQFRSTVAWSYVLSYAESFLAVALLPMIPWQKAEAHRRKREWSSNSVMAAIVLVIPALCLTYGIIVLLLTSQPETACFRWVGGQGCAKVNSTPVPSVGDQGFTGAALEGDPVRIYGGSPTGLQLTIRPPRATQYHELPGVPGAFVLSDVLSAQECHMLRQATEAMGYRPDVPLSSELDERAHNVVLMANDFQNTSLFDRVKHLLPSKLGQEKLLGINRRWRFYRYLSGNLFITRSKASTAQGRAQGFNCRRSKLFARRYRKHLDGAWPASGLKRGEDGQDEYVYDAYGGGTRSKLTFIIYLNDDFEGGCTTFYTPNPGSSQ